MKGWYATLRRYGRGLYAFSSIMLLMLLALLFRDASAAVWRSTCLVLFIGAVLYEVMWRSDRKTCLEVIMVMWSPAIFLCMPLFLFGLVRGFVMWQRPVYEVHILITGLPYALLIGGGFSMVFLTIITVFWRN